MSNEGQFSVSADDIKTNDDDVEIVYEEEESEDAVE